jgi:hypothetical protein
MEYYTLYTKPFKSLYGSKLTRKHGESKKDFIKRCRANNKAYSKFMNTRFTIKPYTVMEKIQREEQYMIERWDLKHPQPEPNLFDTNSWNEKREAAIEHIRDVIVSRYDKLNLIGRFKKKEKEFIEKNVAQIKDIGMEGHKVNELSEKSRLLKKAKSVTNELHRRTPSLVCTILQDHKRKRGHMILPRAA